MGSEVSSELFKVKPKKDIPYTYRGGGVLRAAREYEAKKIGNRVAIHDDENFGKVRAPRDSVWGPDGGWFVPSGYAYLEDVEIVEEGVDDAELQN
jgi:hypothetical protein